VSIQKDEVYVDFPESVQKLLAENSGDDEFFAVFDVNGNQVFGAPGLTFKVGKTNPYITHDIYQGMRINKATYKVSTPSSAYYVVVAETIKHREEAATTILTGMIFPSLFLFISALLIVYFGVRSGLRPLNELSSEIKNRDRNDFSSLPENSVPVEALQLISSINLLIDNLRISNAEKKDFVANAAHQIKTPLAGINTQLELLKGEVSEESIPRINLALQASERLSHYIHQLSALARSNDALAIAPYLKDINLARIIEQESSHWFDISNAQGITIEFEPNECLVRGSIWHIREMISNLIDNAIKYTQVNGTIWISSGIDLNNCPFVEVKDNGPGIPQKLLGLIGTRHYRPENPSINGSGLGLAIVKEIAEKHDATVHFLDTNQEEGTCIRVIFSPIHQT
jgi:two-component system sensor histidine kinase TctE